MSERLEREPHDYEWVAKCSRFVHEAKSARRMIRVRYGPHQVGRGQTYEGRIYRNSYDRLNVISLDRPNDSHHEAYYFKLDLLEMLGPLPDVVPDYSFSDWDYYVEIQ